MTTPEVAPEVAVPPGLRQPWRREAGSGHLVTTWDRASGRVLAADAWRRADNLGRTNIDRHRFAPSVVYRWEVRAWDDAERVYDRGFTETESLAQAAAERSMLDYHAGVPRPPSRRCRQPKASA